MGTGIDPHADNISGFTDIEHAERAFRASHAARLEQARARLPDSARAVLDALPLLLHANHPSLPGFCGFDSPAGIHGYQPDSLALNAARRFSRNYRYVRANERRAEIAGLYFMGSAGSVAHTRSSDLDVWVCVEEEKHAALSRKLERLARWARSQGVELQAFAVSPGQFNGGVEAAYSPLLLDEFYRTACHLAGKIPLWWVVPEEDPGRYETAAHVTRRFIQATRFLDFGPVQPFAPMELLAAGVRELERSLKTPYKSLLKLTLLESYAERATPLSTRYRRAIIASANAGEVDGYLMLAEHLDGHFGAKPGSQQRLTFMRRAWLTKTSRGNVHLTKSPEWRQLTRRWGFGPGDIEHLRRPETWSLTNIVDEHTKIMAEYAHALSFLGHLANLAESEPANARIYTQRLDNLRAELLSATMYNDRLLPVLVPGMQQGHAVIRANSERQWCLEEDGRVFVRRPRLAHIFLWLKRQGLGLGSLAPQMRENSRYRQIFAALLTEPRVLVLNAETGATMAADAQAEALISETDDPLAYGNERHCLIRELDLLRTTAREQVQTQTWQSLVHALPELLTLPQIPVACIGDVRRARVAQRLEQLLTEARAQLKNNQTNFIFTLGPNLCCLHRDRWGEFQAQLFPDAYAAYLSCPPAAATYFSQTGSGAHRGWLETERVLNHPTLILNAQSSALNLDYRDAHGSERLEPPPRRAEEFAQSLHLICAALKQRGVIVPQLRVYRGNDDIQPLPRRPIEQHLRYRLAFRQHRHGWEVRCGQELWAIKRIDRRVLRQVQRQVLTHRQGDENYPIYLNDIELIGADFITHLRAKFALETMLSGDIGTSTGNLKMFRDLA